jgi:hypothetical protein
MHVFFHLEEPEAGRGRRSPEVEEDGAKADVVREPAVVQRNEFRSGFVTGLIDRIILDRDWGISNRDGRGDDCASRELDLRQIGAQPDFL